MAEPFLLLVSSRFRLAHSSFHGFFGNKDVLLLSFFFQVYSSIHLRQLRARQTYRRLISDIGVDSMRRNFQVNLTNFTPDLLVS